MKANRGLAIALTVQLLSARGKWQGSGECCVSPPPVTAPLPTVPLSAPA